MYIHHACSPRCIPFKGIHYEDLLYYVIYVLRGASSLLVLVHRVMRRPLDVERVTGILSTHFLYIYVYDKLKGRIGGEGGGRELIYEQKRFFHLDRR